MCGGGGLGYLDRLYTKHPLTVKYKLLVYMYLANHQKPILKCTLKLYPMPCSIKTHASKHSFLTFSFQSIETKHAFLKLCYSENLQKSCNLYPKLEAKDGFSTQYFTLSKAGAKIFVSDIVHVFRANSYLQHLRCMSTPP